MRVTIRPQAESDLDEIYDWIAQDDPVAAERVVRRLAAFALGLRDFPLRGRERPDVAASVRSLSVGTYLILYRVEADGVEIVRIVHGARDISGLV